MPQFIDSIEYTDTEGSKVALDGITNVSTVDASTLSVTSAINIIPDSNGAVNPGGRGSGTIGNSSTALGYTASAEGIASTALGYDTSAGGDGSTALGRSASAGGGGSAALGWNAIASGNSSTALGYSASAEGIGSTALGYDTSAGGEGSVALGYGASADVLNSTALGRSASAGGEGSVALGRESTASGGLSVAIGSTAKASGTQSIALGYATKAEGDYSTALGNNSTAAGNSSMALGYAAYAANNYSMALGRAAHASNNSSTALGYAAHALGDSSTALGTGAEVPSTDSNTMRLGGPGLSALRCKVNLTVTSDKRDKTDIEDITDALAFIERLNPVTFVSNDRVDYISDEDKKGETFHTYGMCEYDRVSHAAGTKKGERRRCGLLAQEVVEAMQSVYGTDNYANVVNDNFHDLTEKPSDVENKYTLAYANLVPFLIGAIKELNAKIEILEGKLATSSVAGVQED